MAERRPPLRIKVVGYALIAGGFILMPAAEHGNQMIFRLQVSVFSVGLLMLLIDEIFSPNVVCRGVFGIVVHRGWLQFMFWWLILAILCVLAAASGVVFRY